ncbi:MAG: hypothetical protein DCC68_04745 [Planctomycetota bacterium]|nr:MAG: hypothetical protein DCC68_04745 [Planctomycetota bacterium]
MSNVETSVEPISNTPMTAAAAKMSLRALRTIAAGSDAVSRREPRTSGATVMVSSKPLKPRLTCGKAQIAAANQTAHGNSPDDPPSPAEYDTPMSASQSKTSGGCFAMCTRPLPTTMPTAVR